MKLNLFVKPLNLKQAAVYLTVAALLIITLVLSLQNLRLLDQFAGASWM